MEWLHYGRYLHERMQGKPTQYITKRQEFYGREFRVTPDVLIPRPETEHVVEVALAAGSRRSRRILDVGTGSGALAVTLQLETGVETIATDISPAAAQVAADNAERLGARVSLVVCDLMDAIADRLDGPDRVQPALRSAEAIATDCSAKCAIGSRTWRSSAESPASTSTIASSATHPACCVPAAIW